MDDLENDLESTEELDLPEDIEDDEGDEADVPAGDEAF